MARRDSFGGYEEERFKDKVDIQLQCSICHKVLKDPVQCPNEHYFCRSCMQKSLRENSEACPVCEHHLTEKTLTKPPRILMGFLQNLEIGCDHVHRGCEEFIKLEFLDQHVASCGYSPTRCTNVGCTEVTNRSEKERHEREQCDFRKIVCDECGEQVIWKSSRVHPCFMRNEMDDLARRLNFVQNDMRDVQNDVKDVQNDVKEVKDEAERVKLTQKEMAYLTKEGSERYNLLTGRQKIFVCGGSYGRATLNSVESYSWPENSWTLEAAMKKARSSPSAFVHGREIHVSGGWDGTKHTDSIENLNIDKQCPQWMESAIKMPIKCGAHKMVSHENSAILTDGLTDGDKVSDVIYEISLNPPHKTRPLTSLTCYYAKRHGGRQTIDDKLIMAGGTTSQNLKDATRDVYAYDLNNNTLTCLPSLPFSISGMATVSYKGNVILIGGVNEKSQTLNSVVMYNVKTGEIKMLPCLNHKRATSAAVIAGNVIIVMGGYDYETKTFLNSVECLDLSTNVWRELSPMKIKRTALAAVLTPVIE